MDLRCTKCGGLVIQEWMQLDYQKWESVLKCVICRRPVYLTMLQNRRNFSKIKKEAEKDQKTITKWWRKEKVRKKVKKDE